MSGIRHLSSWPQSHVGSKRFSRCTSVAFTALLFWHFAHNELNKHEAPEKRHLIEPDIEQHTRNLESSSMVVVLPVHPRSATQLAI